MSTHIKHAPSLGEPLAGETNRDAISAAPLPAQQPRKSLSLHFSERKLLLATFDALFLNLALLIALNLRSDLGAQAPVSGHFWGHAHWFVVLSAVWFACAFVFGCYNLGRAARVWPSLVRAGAAVVATWLVYLLIPYATPVLPTSRAGMMTFPALALLFVGLGRVIYALVFVQPGFHQCALVVGGGWAGGTLAQVVRETESGKRRPQHGIGYRILGFIDDDPTKQGEKIEGYPVLGTSHDLVNYARALYPHEIVVAITHPETMDAALFDAIMECREMGISITPMAALYEQLTGRVPIEHAGRALWVAMPQSQSSTYRFYLAFQRLFDIVVGLLGCVLLGCVMPFVWLANRFKSPGPLFYVQERTGRSGHPFQIVKFRSMRTDAEKFSGAVWAEENDPRITPIGRILRGTRLDEIPQFWNVLKGEMSLIGPRPERPHFIEQLAREIPFYRARHAVKPGLTGWAQTRYRYGASVEDSLIKLQYDLYYIKHQNLLLDLEIVFQTVPIVLGFKGR